MRKLRDLFQQSCLLINLIVIPHNMMIFAALCRDRDIINKMRKY